MEEKRSKIILIVIMIIIIGAIVVGVVYSNKNESNNNITNYQSQNNSTTSNTDPITQAPDQPENVESSLDDVKTESKPTNNGFSNEPEGEIKTN